MTARETPQVFALCFAIRNRDCPNRKPNPSTARHADILVMYPSGGQGAAMSPLYWDMASFASGGRPIQPECSGLRILTAPTFSLSRIVKEKKLKR